MGATTVPIDEIVATTRAFDPDFQGADRDDSNHVLYATPSSSYRWRWQRL